MDKLTAVIGLDEVDPAPIVDVRSVPLNLLQDDPDCDSLVARIMDKHAGRSHVPVATFSSAI
jgi:hypothetical protein